MAGPKTEFLQIRVSPDDRERFRRVAESEHLDVSTWARRVLLQAIEQRESGQDIPSAPRRRVAEPTPGKGDSARERRKK